MKKVCRLLERRPWLIGLAAGVGLLIFIAGTHRLPVGPGLERIVGAVRLAALLCGILALRDGARSRRRPELWALIGIACLALFLGVTLAAWMFRA